MAAPISEIKEKIEETETQVQAPKLSNGGNVPHHEEMINTQIKKALSLEIRKNRYPEY